jgi:hypothetical protein
LRREMGRGRRRMLERRVRRAVAFVVKIVGGR